MAPYLGQGANQAIQDAHVLASVIADIGKNTANLKDALHKYEIIRRMPTMALMRSSNVIGLLETQGGQLGMMARNTLLTVGGFMGATQRAFITACIPRVGNYDTSKHP